MAFKSLLTILTDNGSLDKTLTACTALARSLDAHLDVLCLGVEPTPLGYDYMGAGGFAVQELTNLARERADSLEVAARKFLTQQDIRFAVQSLVVATGTLAQAVGQHARFCDLAVQPKPYGQPNRAEAEAAVEAALFDAAVPVLVLPDGQMPAFPAKRIIMAWNQSREAMRAVRAAIPLLQGAELVTVMVVDPAGFGAERSDPGGALSQLLARHGVQVEVTVLAKTLPRFCDMLNRHARDRDADMVVMGAYGHSRLRESILGGATRGMLEQAEIPVFMAH